MIVAYVVTPDLRIKLKEPFGNLIEGPSEETMAKIKELIEKERPPKVISVGDVVSSNLHKNSIDPQLTIIDNISQRDQKIAEDKAVEKTVYVDNPQGTITLQAIWAVKEALDKDEHTHIVVKGEEDLLTLLAVLYAPVNTFVIYGQPYCGVVVVKVTSESKDRAQKVLNAMKSSKS
jgi:uncharacterized protein (UPF0218 family)